MRTFLIIGNDRQMREQKEVSIAFCGLVLRVRTTPMSRRPEKEGRYLVVLRNNHFEFVYFIPVNPNSAAVWKQYKETGAKGWVEWPKIIDEESD